MNTTPLHRSAPSRRAASRGVATLVVVMVLFLVVSLVAAYTNRSLVFEQRTSANQYRSTQAFEISDAGLQWAIAMLNGSRIDETCQPTTDLAKTTFRQRYLNIDATTGIITPVVRAPSGAVLYAACVLAGTSWNCSCPSNDNPSPTVPTSTGMHPAFQIRFYRDPAAAAALPPGLIRLESVTCPTYDSACLSIDNAAGGEGRIVTTALVALQSALKTPPSAALTVRQDISVGANAIQAYNTEAASGGVAVQLGGVVDAASKGVMVYEGPPGTPNSFALIENDTSLSTLAGVPGVLDTAGDRMFATVFGLKPAVFSAQPGATMLTCPCTAQDLRDALAQNPSKVILANGSVAIDTAGDIGSAAEPVIVVATGDITFTIGGVTVYGVLYSRNATWSTAGSGTVRGAVIAENALGGTGTATYVYDSAVLEVVRRRYGSFVGLPGSFKDYSPLQ